MSTPEIQARLEQTIADHEETISLHEQTIYSLECQVSTLRDRHADEVRDWERKASDLEYELERVNREKDSLKRDLDSKDQDIYRLNRSLEDARYGSSRGGW